jgi:GNAT superfamily N-acetyltransferase
VKGQKLWIRKLSPADSPEIEAFTSSHDSPPPDHLSSQGWLARIAGQLVAVAAVEPLSDRVATLRLLLVAPDLRRKRVGTLLLQQIEQELGAAGFERLETAVGSPLASFLLRRGFEHHGDRLARSISPPRDPEGTR